MANSDILATPWVELEIGDSIANSDFLATPGRGGRTLEGEMLATHIL